MKISIPDKNLENFQSLGPLGTGGFPIWTFLSFSVLCVLFCPFCPFFPFLFGARFFRVLFCLFCPFCPFCPFPDFFGIVPICLEIVQGFSRFVLFLFLGLLTAPMRNSPERVRDTIWTFPEKSGKPPGLETPQLSFSQRFSLTFAVSRLFLENKAKGPCRTKNTTT